MKKVEQKFKILKNPQKRKKEKEMFFARPTLLFALPLLLGGVVQGAYELRIHNADELITFSESVISGTSYSGTTVYLDSDIDFTPSLSQQFEPIGNSSYYFKRTFDGQGHNQQSCHELFFCVCWPLWILNWSNHQECCCGWFLLFYQFIQF